MSLSLLHVRQPPQGGTSVNFNVTNADAFLNMAKSVSWISNPVVCGFLDANQLPQGNPNQGGLQSNCSWFGDYNDFIMKYTGNSNFGISSGPLLFYSISPSGAVAGIAGTSGVANGSTSFNLSATNPRAQLALGDIISSTSSNGGWQQFGLSTTGFGNVGFSSAATSSIASISGSGTIATVTTTAPHGLPTGLQVHSVISGVSPSGFNTPAFSNSTITVTGASTFTYSNTTSGSATVPGVYGIRTATLRFGNIPGLLSSANVSCYRASSSSIVLVGVASGTYTPTTAGGVGTQSEVRYSATSLTAVLGTSVGTLAWSNVIICAVSDEATLTNTTQQIKQRVVDSFAAIKCKYIRFMDAVAVINSTQSNFVQRQTQTSSSYGARLEPTNWAGQMIRAAGDQYTASNPSGSGVGAYAEGECATSYADFVATTNTPSLQLGTRGFKPIFGITCTPLTIRIGGTITNGDTISMTFTGSQIAGSPLTKIYTVNPAVDTSIDKLGANITAFWQSDAALQAANFQFSNGGSGTCGLTYARTAGGGTGGTINGVSVGGGTSFSVSLSGGATETVTLGTVDTYEMPNGSQAVSTTGIRNYTFSKILDGWIANTGGIAGGTPIEVCAEVCNRVGCGMWINVPLLYTTAAATSLGALLADPTVLNPNTPIIVELSNEAWNFGQFQTTMAANLSNGLGFAGVTYADFYALRFVQLLAQAFVAGYTGAGGARSNIQLTIADTVLEGNGGYSGIMQAHRWNGVALNTSNAIYAALGGPNCTPTSANYDTAPTRPIDFADATSYAVYFRGALIQGTASNSFTGGAGQQSFYNTMFQASADYATGIPASMTSALNVWNQDILTGKRNGASSGATLQSFFDPGKPIPGWQAKVSSYDAQRLGFSAPAVSAPINVYAYEAGLEQALGSDPVNGLQTADPTATIAAFGGQFTANIPTPGTTTLQVTAVTSGVIIAGISFSANDGVNPALSASISSQLSGTPGGIGTYQISKTATLNSTTCTWGQGYTLFPTYGADNATVAQNMVNLYLAYRNSTQCHDMTQNNYCAAIAQAHPGRKAYAGWYGYSTSNVWGFYPGDLTTTPYQTWNGFKDFAS